MPVKKKDVKALFVAIRHGELAAVRSLLAALPELLHATASAPPKKDDGQSPLQVALKTGATEIAHLLLDLGADVNHIETSEINEWRAPALHDAVRATVMTLCYYREFAARSDAARAVLGRLLEKGANPNAVDSYGNNALIRAILDSAQALDPVRGAETAPLREEKVRAVFSLLLAAGGNVNAPSASGRSALELARGMGLERLLKP